MDRSSGKKFARRRLWLPGFHHAGRINCTIRDEFDSNNNRIFFPDDWYINEIKCDGILVELD